MNTIAAIRNITSAQRVALYNKLTKKSISKFADLEKGISACTGAAKAAGQENTLIALAEIGVDVANVNKKANGAQPAPKAAVKAAKSPEPAAAKKADKPAKVAAKADKPPKLSIMDKIAKIAAKPKKPVTENAAAKRGIIKVKPTFAGTSKMQSASIRAKVLQIINDNKAGIEVVEIGKQIGSDARGYVQKLLEKNHCEVVA